MNHSSTEMALCLGHCCYNCNLPYIHIVQGHKAQNEHMKKVLLLKEYVFAGPQFQMRI